MINDTIEFWMYMYCICLPSVLGICPGIVKFWVMMFEDDEPN